MNKQVEECGYTYKKDLYYLNNKVDNHIGIRSERIIPWYRFYLIWLIDSIHPVMRNYEKLKGCNVLRELD